MNRTVTVACSVCALGAIALAGCGPSPQPAPAGNQASSVGGGSGAAAAPAWLLAAAPADAVGVAQVKAEAKEGDRVVIRGRIGGRAEPMTEGSPIFIVMEPAIPSCADNPEDRCRTPWDYCCEPAEVKAANNATIQIVTEAGEPVTESLQGAGLAPLDEIIAVGVVGARPDPTVLTVRATAVYRVPR